jgi:hypothetical protein
MAAWREACIVGELHRGKADMKKENERKNQPTNASGTNAAETGRGGGTAGTAQGDVGLGVTRPAGDVITTEQPNYESVGKEKGHPLVPPAESGSTKPGGGSTPS